MDDSDGPGCLGFIAGLSVIALVLLSFPAWRRGLVSLGLSETTSWWLGIIGAFVFAALTIGITRLAHRYAVNRDYAEDVGCLPVLGAVAVGIVIALLYGRVVVAGDPPTWFVDPPSLAGLILDDPPTWLLVTERIAECVTGTVIVFASRRR